MMNKRTSGTFNAIISLLWLTTLFRNPQRCVPIPAAKVIEQVAFNVISFKDMAKHQLMSCFKKYGLKPAKEAQNGRFQKISIPIPRTAFRISKGEGGSRLRNSGGIRGGIYDWKSEGMGEFHRWDFWRRKCRVSSLKTLLLWTFVVRK